MNSILPSAVAGLVAALAATLILGVANYVRRSVSLQQDISYVRELLIEGEELLMSDKVIEVGGKAVSPNLFRAEQYNLVTKRLRVALDGWLPNLSHDHRRDLFNALDWYHSDTIAAVSGPDGEPEFVTLPEGQWPKGVELDKATVEEKFKTLKEIEWLNL